MPVDFVDFDEYKPSAGSTDYVVKYDNFITVLQGYAQELEDARENENTLWDNLDQNYIGYVLGNNLDGSSTDGSDGYKCINMKNAVDAQDYITWDQAQSIGGTTQPTNITDVSVGQLLANDILVVNKDGNAITGRPCTYSTLANGATVAANGNYDMALSGNKTIYLPSGASDGTTISFADIQGNLSSFSLTITPESSGYIMGLALNETLIMDTYDYCSFDLVFSGISGFGWTLARFQM